MLDNEFHQFLLHAFMGLSFAFLVCTLAIFYHNRKIEFLLYALFLLSVNSYFGFFSAFVKTWLPDVPMANYVVIQNMAQVATNLCYLLFSRYYLNTKEVYPKFHRVLNIVAVSLAVFIVVYLIWWGFGASLTTQRQLMDVQRLVMALFVIFSTFYLLRHKENNFVYVILGAAFLFTAGAVTTWITYDLVWMVVGSGFENFVFSYGLGYKIKKLNDEKLIAERDAIQNQMNSLRAQMNPHFIFNSLNSILGFILKGDKKESIRYLSNFSDLLRKILNTSENGSISLEQEISLLKLYLELESLRFNKNFDYSIEVDKKLDIHNLEIPVLLIQPYIENSIIHGLAPKTIGTKKIRIAFNDSGDFINCIIEDSGIGRAAAQELKRKKKIYHKSKGMSITQKRIALMNRQNLKGNSLVDIEDLFDSEGEPAGTKVSLRIYKPHLN